jgi:hypothetical protein
MIDLKKLKKLDLRLPSDFEQSVWKSIYTRMPQSATVSVVARGVDWGDLLWMQPAWLGGLVCAVMLTGMALGQLHGSFSGGYINQNQNMTELYVNSLSQGENI